MLYSLYFSARGTTRTCADRIAAATKLETRSADVRDGFVPEFSEGDALLLSLPVYGGFVPNFCLPWLDKLQGKGTPAVIAAVYGNRHYDNALLQMKDILTSHGFVVVAAGAFLAEHSLFTNVATGRPDAIDLAALDAFGKRCAELITSPRGKSVDVPGSPDYVVPAPKAAPFCPDGDDSCINCGACVSVCPVGAIDENDPKLTDASKCVACGACIVACPVNSRGYHNEKFAAAAAGFAQKCAARREAEVFYAE